MAKPVIAVVGRPNVGKSTLFNKLTGQRTAIVDDTPGVTRDRIYGEIEWCGHKASLIEQAVSSLIPTTLFFLRCVDRQSLLLRLLMLQFL